MNAKELDDLTTVTAERDRLKAELAHQKHECEQAHSPAIVVELRAELAAAREVIVKQSKAIDAAFEVAGNDPCYYDHHGYCQSHNLQPKGECWAELVREAALAAKGGGR